MKVSQYYRQYTITKKKIYQVSQMNMAQLSYNFIKVHDKYKYCTCYSISKSSTKYTDKIVSPTLSKTL